MKKMTFAAFAAVAVIALAACKTDKTTGESESVKTEAAAAEKAEVAQTPAETVKQEGAVILDALKACKTPEELEAANKELDAKIVAFGQKVEDLMANAPEDQKAEVEAAAMEFKENLDKIMEEKLKEFIGAK